ncbi:phosphopentomutase [alpha proteobacterium BAL199]|jgi:phosphopentomutase|nr:phosphopentomutase [alpha proteobacterium BAL199]
MTRAFLVVLDSVGIGGAPDADRYGDTGADTLGHIAEACAAGGGDGHGRSGPLAVPNLLKLGLGAAHQAAAGCEPAGLETAAASRGAWGHAAETSRGKDTPSGHWELTGVPVAFDWTYYPTTVPAFPAEFTAALIRQAGLPGVLGDCHASGTEIIARLGEEHVRTGKPILYTSADSVVQIAAHEQAFGLERLYEICRIARTLVPDTVGRVIARPFVGTNADDFARTGNRKDLAVPPPSPTLLQRHSDTGGTVISIGKIGDIFAHQGTGEEVKASGNAVLFDTLQSVTDRAPDGSLVIVNFVDFDSLWGHRRDVAGYAAELEAFDYRLPEFLDALRPGDLAILTADHGNDPTWPGSDHTREQVPVLITGPAAPVGDLGQLAFADVGATLGAHLGLPPGPHGVSRLRSPT